MSDTRAEIVEDQADDARLGRRVVLRGVAVGGVSMTALAAACGSDDGSDSDSDSQSGYGGNESSEPTNENGGGGGGDALGSTSDIPVGGGVVYGDQDVVVTQPTEGDFLAFTAICTHQGCTVASVADGTINCDCHGSKFSIEDGSVANGPATEPLATESVSVEGGQLKLG